MIKCSAMFSFVLVAGIASCHSDHREGTGNTGDMRATGPTLDHEQQIGSVDMQGTIDPAGPRSLPVMGREARLPR